MTISDLDTASALLDAAKAAGADQTDVLVIADQAVSIGVSGGELEEAEELCDQIAIINSKHQDPDFLQIDRFNWQAGGAGQRQDQSGGWKGDTARAIWNI